MPDERNQRKVLYLLVLSSILLGTSALVFAATGDAPQVFLVTLAGLAGSFAMRRPLPRTSRSFVYTGALVATVTVLGNQLFPIEPGRFFLIPAEIYGPGIIFLGVAATYFDQRETNLTAVVALALLGLMLAGNAVSPLAKNVHFPVTAAVRDNYHAFYAAAVAVEALALLLLIRRATPRIRVGAPHRRCLWLRYLVVIVGLGATVAAVGGLRLAAKAYERTMQQFFVQWMQRYMQRRARWVLFQDEVDLWRTAPLRAAADRTVVLRARSKTAPGYLRGRAYHQYNGGRWTAALGATGLAGDDAGPRLTFTTFRREPQRDASREDSAPGRRIEVFPARNFRSDVLLVPGSAEEFELIATQLREDWNGTLIPRDWESNTGYNVRVARGGFMQAYNGPLPRDSGRFPEKRLLLSVPADLEGPLSAAARRILGPIPERLDSRTKIARLEAYFTSKFAYALGTAPDREDGRDPVLQFLDRRRGHCELFAAAATLLLRVTGTPARYVTGFVCAEPHPGREYWLSRLKDAHAWSEAWVAEEGRWLPVECTPAAGVPDGASQFSALGAWFDRLVLFWQEILVQMKRGYVAEALVGLVVGLLTACRWLLWHPVRGPLLLAGAVWLWCRRRRRRLLQIEAEWAGVAPEKREARRRLARLERAVRGRGLDRQPAMTLREWGRQLAVAPDLPAVREIVEFLARYERVRYAAAAPPEVLVDLDRRLRTILRELRRAPHRKRPRRRSGSGHGEVGAGPRRVS
ncbi:MAG: DUF4129 domain-containing protein [Kiritimatiellaeota bacterium]|nr:DUF4129 domain-containing protein [Kiritimatiellota bacterium]